MFTNRRGGIIDDCIITRTGESSFYIVSNASRAEIDLKHLQVHRCATTFGNTRDSAGFACTTINDVVHVYAHWKST